MEKTIENVSVDNLKIAVELIEKRKILVNSAYTSEMKNYIKEFENIQ